MAFKDTEPGGLRLPKEAVIAALEAELNDIQGKSIVTEEDIARAEIIVGNIAMFDNEDESGGYGEGDLGFKNHL